MKKITLFRRMTSLIICLALLVTCLPLGLLNTQAAQNILTDDFEGTDINWTLDSASQPSANSIITIGQGETANKVFHPYRAYVPENLGYSNVYTYNGTWPERKISSVTGTIHAGTVSPTFVGLVIVYYYKDANNWRGLCFTQETASQTAQNIRFCGKENGVANDFAGHANHIYGGTLTAIAGIDTTFTITYNTDGTASMVLTNSTGTSPAIPLLTGAASFAGRKFENAIKANEGQFAMANGGWVTDGKTDYFDDITITFAKSDDELAAAFSATHSVILSKTEETVTPEDSQAITFALEEYSKLSDGARALLSAQYNLLLELNYAINSASFSGSSFTETFSGDMNWMRVDAADDAISRVTADGKFLPADAKKSNSGYEDLVVAEGYSESFTPDIPIYIHKYWPKTREIKTISGKYTVTKQHHRGSLIIYYYKDINNWRGVYITNNGTNMHIKYLMKESDALDKDTVYYAHTAATYYDAGIPSAGPFTYDTECDFVLTYGEDGKVVLKLMQGTNTVEAELPAAKEFTTLAPNVSNLVYNKDSVYKSVDGGKTFTAMAYTHEQDNVTYYLSEQYTFSAINAKSGQFAMGVGKIGSTFDDIKVSFVQSIQEMVDEFKTVNAEILGKTESTVTVSDKEILIEAFDHYARLPADAKAELADELDYLNKLAYVLAPASKVFIERYNAYWSKTTDDMTYYDRETLAQAIADYNALDDFSKELTADKKALLDDLYEAAMSMFLPRDPKDFSDFDADFEDDYFPFRNVFGEINGTSEAGIVVDPTDPTGKNHVFLVRNGSSGVLMFTPCAELWNAQAQMKTISTRIYMDGLNVFAPPIFIYDYKDAENMRGVYFSNTGALMLYTMADGIEGQKILRVAPFLEDFHEGWVNYNFTFAGSRASLVVELPDGTSESFSLDCTAGARFGFKTYSSWGHIGQPAYFDDLHVTMTKGDFDVDQTIEDISVYYSENALIYPNETILLSGERLGETVESVQINRLEDIAPSDTDKAAYIKETNYDTSGEYDGLTKPTEPTWNSGAAKNVKILQTTKNSIKVVVPEEYETGIYAIKLTPKTTSAKGATFYVNDPRIRTIIGDEGELATRGGYIRIIGNNLLPTGSIQNVKVQLKNASGETFNFPVTKYYEDDNYSLECAVPEDFAYGEYEVFVYNGYGDKTAWSAPGKVKIAASPRDSWPTKVFNVRDFGAVGDTQTNDTPAIVNALNAAAKNGGGIVYFPETEYYNGAYRVVTTLAIPQNVVIKGDGTGNSQIMWSANRWQYKEVPPLMVITGNVEIADIGLYTSRGASIITTTAAPGHPLQHSFVDPGNYADNIYIRNVKIRTQWNSGMLTQGGGGILTGTGKQTVDEVRNAVLAEMVSLPRIQVSFGGAQNLQLEDVSLIDAPGALNYGIHTNHEYTQIRNCHFESGWHSFTSLNGLIYEDNEHTRAATGATGVGVYIARNYMHHVMQNNRELFTIDGQPFAQNMTVQFIGPDEKIMGKGKTDDVTYKIIDRSYKDDQLVGYEIIVGSGQGLGQVRRIVSQKGNTFTIDRPFTISPNRNSRVWFTVPRHGWFFVDNYFEEGAACGTSGTLIDSVWDKNYFTLHGGQKFATRDGPNWYLSMVNQVMEDPWYMHGEGIGYDCTFNTFSRVQMHAMNAFASEIVIGFVWRRNDFGEYYIHIQRAPYYSGIRDMILENNKMSGVEYIIDANTESVSYIEGTLIRDNDFESANPEAYKGSHFIAGQTELNKYGSPRCLIVHSAFDPSGNNLGDVNADGKVNLKDSTMIRLSIFGIITLTRDQIIRADVNKDSNITMKDANRIRKYLLEGIPLDSDIGTGDDTSSDSSSSDDSSSGGSSSGDSSGDSSSGSSSSDAGFLPGTW